MEIWEVNIETNLHGLQINNPQEKFAKHITEQFRNKLGVAVTYEILGDAITIYLEKKNEEKRKIPYKIVNGQIVVPEEFQKYLSKDRKSLNINEASDYNTTINNIDLNIFK